MKKYTILVTMLLVSLGCVYAQDATTTTTTTTTSSDGDFAPAAGDITVSILFGRGNFLNSGLAVPSVPNTSWTVSGQAPYANNIDANDNSITNMVGAEARYFLSSTLALKLSGGAIMRNTPSRPNYPGYIQGDNNAAWIPAYDAVVADNRVDANINLGGEWHFTTSNNRVQPWAGLTVPFYYARQSYYNPTIDYDTNPSDPDSDPDDLEPDGGSEIVDIGIRSAQIFGFGAQAVGGIDYYLANDFFFGLEIKPISVIYAYSDKIPGAGYETAKASTTTWSFFSQPFIKVGFRF